MKAAAALLGLALASGAAAQSLDLPGNAVRVSEEAADPGTAEIAIGPYAEGRLPSLTVDGRVARSVWRIASAGLTTAQIMARLGAQLGPAGFETVYACDTDACGGFDFRFALDVADPPDMHVDLSDFRYLAARRPEDDALLSILVSRSALAGFVQITRAGGEGAAPVAEATDDALTGEAAAPVVPPAAGEVGAQLEAAGHAVLGDLSFATGSSTLDEGSYPALADLAAWMAAHPGQAVALVGHTDAEGSLDANIALSRRRAASVLERLVDSHGVDRARLSAEGMGWLAPLASNLSAEGREANRRVEAVLLPE
ncbi:membrane protein [Wenxinia marina]|uniref:OmpA family protein n=1 Tax=Wenxinia marina TaxID=390641 RepID=UPI00037A7E23|nr:OmpA family protein [Wenxinia marina]GGL56759.1 membrane protein [Wenxinia marina]